MSRATRIKLSRPSIFLVLLVFLSSCITTGGETNYIYGSNVDRPGTALLLWPADEEGSVFHLAIQPPEGLRTETEAQLLPMPHEGEWRLGGEEEVESVVVVLSPEPGPRLRARGSEIEAGLSTAYPNANFHLVRSLVAPYDIRFGIQLHAALREAWLAHLARRSNGRLGDTFVDSYLTQLSMAALAEFGITPLAGAEDRFAVFTPMPGAEDGIVIRETSGENLVDVFRDLAVEVQERRKAGNPSEWRVRTGRVRVFLPHGAPDEVRLALFNALSQVQAELPPEGEEGTAPPPGPWRGIDTMELWITSARRMKWEERHSIEDLRTGGLWLLLYFED